MYGIHHRTSGNNHTLTRQSSNPHFTTSQNNQKTHPTHHHHHHDLSDTRRVSSPRETTRVSTPERRGNNTNTTTTNNNFKVVIRVRPPLPRELEGERPFQNVIQVDSTGHRLCVSENLTAALAADESSNSGTYNLHSFTFDHVYDQGCTQRTVYENTAQSVVESSLQGYNATIFAYGQTGTGKTYTMEGFNCAGSVEARGIIPRAIEQIFEHIQRNVSMRMRFLVRASYLQIYNESISDLLKPERAHLSIREDKKRGVFVEGLSEWVVRSPAEIYGLMERGGAVRATGSTKMNELSSRSHAVFIIIAEQSETLYVDENGHEISMEQFSSLMNAKGEKSTMMKMESNVRQSFKVGKLNLVDLAGSERVRLSGATGQRLEESKKINQSLSALGNVIAALTDVKGRQHIPYRDSKLTRILEDSLGGNCKTTMMAMVSPALEAMVESLSTLKFANRAKHIKNEARVNEDLDQKSLLRKYERELKRLRAELDEKNKNVVDKRRLLELDEQCRRAEQDKMAAIRALEQRSLEFMKEKEEKRCLEQRICTLTSQMLMSTDSKNNKNDPSTADDSHFRNALKEHQEKIRKEYECRLADLERERETIEEEKAQVDRYKLLLLKQRDIMIALTQRLNERDEQIVALQDELDAYDRHQKELEEKLDEKTAQLIHLQRVTMEQDVNAPSSIHPSTHPSSIHTNGKKEYPSVKQSLFSSKMLLAYKQFPPYGEKVLYNGKNEATGLDEDTLLLSGEEKIKELTQLLDSQIAEQQRIAQELEDIKAEKVSMEYLLRENKVIPNNFTGQESPLQGTNKFTFHLKSFTNGNEPINPTTNQHHQQRQNSFTTTVEEKEKVIALQMKLHELEKENSHLRYDKIKDDAKLQTQSTMLQQKCDVLMKERRALQKIMEVRMKTLVSNIANASKATLRMIGSEHWGESEQRLVQEIDHLQRLVNNSITALKVADLPEAERSTTSIPTTSSTTSTGSTREWNKEDNKKELQTAQKTFQKTSTTFQNMPMQNSPMPRQVPSSTTLADFIIQDRRAKMQIRSIDKQAS